MNRKAFHDNLIRAIVYSDYETPVFKEIDHMLTAGIDCGAKNTKTVIQEDGDILALAGVPTGFDLIESVARSLDLALEHVARNREDLAFIGATGSGAKSIDSVDIKVNSIKAMAVAARYFFPNAGTVVDVGAEETRVAKIGVSGLVEDFAVNDKCAAGSGAFIETMARALDTPIEEMGPLALSSTNKISMNAQCAIFAESEVVGLIHGKVEKKDISKAIHDAIAGRLVAMIRRVGFNPELCMLGGVARNPGLVEAVRLELGVENMLIPDYPEYAMALAAAMEVWRMKK